MYVFVRVPLDVQVIFWRQQEQKKKREELEVEKEKEEEQLRECEVCDSPREKQWAILMRETSSRLDVFIVYARRDMGPVYLLLRLLARRLALSVSTATTSPTNIITTRTTTTILLRIPVPNSVIWFVPVSSFSDHLFLS